MTTHTAPTAEQTCTQCGSTEDVRASGTCYECIRKYRQQVRWDLCDFYAAREKEAAALTEQTQNTTEHAFDFACPHCRAQWVATCREPEMTTNQPTTITRSGITLSWSKALGCYVTIPE